MGREAASDGGQPVVLTGLIEPPYPRLRNQAGGSAKLKYPAAQPGLGWGESIFVLPAMYVSLNP